MSTIACVSDANLATNCPITPQPVVLCVQVCLAPGYFCAWLALTLSSLQCHGLVVGAYLSRVDLLAGESVVVGPHGDDVVTAISLCSVAASSPVFVVNTLSMRLRSVVVGKPAPSPAAHSRNCRSHLAKIPWRSVRSAPGKAAIDFYRLTDCNIDDHPFTTLRT